MSELHNGNETAAPQTKGRMLFPALLGMGFLAIVIACCIAVAVDIAPWNYNLYIQIGLPGFSFLLLLSNKIYIKHSKARRALELTSTMAYDFFLVSFFTEPITEMLSSFIDNYDNLFRILTATVINCLLTALFYFLIDKNITLLLNKKQNAFEKAC